MSQWRKFVISTGSTSLTSIGLLYLKRKFLESTDEDKVSEAKSEKKISDPEAGEKISDTEGSWLEDIWPPQWVVQFAVTSLIPPSFYLTVRIIKLSRRGTGLWLVCFTPLLLNLTGSKVGGFKIGSILTTIGLLMTTVYYFNVVGRDVGCFLLCTALAGIAPLYCVYENECKKPALVQVLQQTRASWRTIPKKRTKKAKDFWASQTKQIAKAEKERKKTAKKPKKQWKFQTAEKPIVKIETAGTKEITVTSPRDSKGNLRQEIAGVKSRAQLLQEARDAEEKKLEEDVERMRMKREKSMVVLEASEFKAAQEAVSRALLKRPDDYEDANNEDTLTLFKGMKDIFVEDYTPDQEITEEKVEAFVDILQSAGILISAPADTPKPQAETEGDPKPESQNNVANLLPPAGSAQAQQEQAKPVVLKEINLNASQFLHTIKEREKEIFVNTVCQLLEKKPTFEEVKFNYGALDENNVVKIAESLIKCENLQAVYLDSNDFGGKGVSALIKLMDTHRDTLTTLSMQNLPVWQNISTELLGKFVEAIERSTALVKLGFDLKEFRHQEYKDRVAKALKRNSEKARLEKLRKKRENE